MWLLSRCIYCKLNCWWWICWCYHCTDSPLASGSSNCSYQLTWCECASVWNCKVLRNHHSSLSIEIWCSCILKHWVWWRYTCFWISISSGANWWNTSSYFESKWITIIWCSRPLASILQLGWSEWWVGVCC